MKCIRSVALAFVAVVVLLGGLNAKANETMNFQGQTIVLLNESTIDAINAEVAQKTLLADKQVAVKALLGSDAFATDGYCETAVKVIATATRPTAAKVQSACITAFNDEDLHLAIANGELSKVVDPSEPNLSFRTKLSMALTGYITILAVGPF